MSNVIGPEDAIAWLNTDDYDSAGYHVAVEHAICALQKQVPMKPVQKKTLAWISDTFKCPVCSKELVPGEGCPRCLQAIAWDQIDWTELEDIGVLNLSVRSYNCLKRAGIDNVHEVIEMIDAGRLHQIRGLGNRSLEEILKKATEFRDERKNP